MYAKMISALFYMFFTCVIFNPQVNGVTIYLYVMLPFLDPGYSRFLAQTLDRWSFPLGIAVVTCLLTTPMSAAKIVSISICVGYLMYTIARRIGYLHFWMGINVAFGIVQFALFYVDANLASQFGPDNVSRLLWGASATQTNPNFYEIFYFTRVSAFSREAGFFSSLLVASLLLYLLEGRSNWKMIVLYAVGLMICFSKSSFEFLIFASLYPFRRQLRGVHPLFAIFAFVAACSGLAIYLSHHNFFESETFAHRLGGFPFLFDARLDDVLQGLNARQLISRYDYLPYIHMERAYYAAGDGTFCGFPGLVADIGLVGALVLLGVVAFTASDGFVMLLTLLITATVGLATVTSFVPIAYLICYWPRFSAFLARHAGLERMRGPLPEGKQIARHRPEMPVKALRRHRHG